MVGDPSMRNRNPLNGKSVQGLYQEYDIFFQEGNNQLEAGILKVNSYIERGRLKIFNTCVNLAKEILNYKFPEVSMDDNKNLDERPVKANDHACDGLRYLVMQLPDDPDLLKTIAYAPPNRYTQSSKNDEYDDDFENEYAKKGGWESYGY